ncbi:heterokaryon incompatibility protein [Penicillium paradoxum]|uniref:heterokaryon incompatibility protein n=1 Tax=Penicillium paradoxum TaxID=176176 RepID=UPI0025478AE7|nr:heterokaryon incompatibility protein [Penicillium paradoxum]KAJ5788246.1 heterokaryon incompatibility protein [Penicillium paradoxum]
MIQIRKRGELRQENNDQCTNLKHASKPLNDENYRTKHTDQCSGCTEVQANSEQLGDILARRKLPLILSIDEHDQNDEIVFQEADVDDGTELNVPYVAISHVWSDGLGNPQRNALPRCQLLRLSHLIRGLNDGKCSKCVYFWLDTICVPPDALKMTEPQNIAMDLMRSTYEKATAVLVLDSWLCNTDGSKISVLERFTQTLSCGWTRRLWTFQEGVLPRFLYIQFANRAYDFDAEMAELQKSADTVTRLTMLPTLVQLYHQLPFPVFQGLSLKARLLAVAHALADRETSVMSDEPLCLGALLNLNVGVLARTKPEARMEKFWTMLHKVPLNLLTLKSQRMDTEGLRWAPRSFLRSTSSSLGGAGPSESMADSSDVEQLDGCVTEQGLVITSPELVVCSGGELFGPCTYVRSNTEETWYSVHVATAEGVYSRLAIATDFDEAGDVRNYAFGPGEGTGPKELAIIASNFDAPRCPADIFVPLRGGYLGVVKPEERDDIIYCELICTVLVQRLEPTHRNIRALELLFPFRNLSEGEEYPQRGRGRESSLDAAIGDRRSSSQLWCLG